MADLRLYRVTIDGVAYVMAESEAAAAQRIERAIGTEDDGIPFTCFAVLNGEDVPDPEWADSEPYSTAADGEEEQTVQQIIDEQANDPVRCARLAERAGQMRLVG